MYIVVIVFIVLVFIGIMCNSMDDETTKNNSNEVDEKLKNKGFKTSKIRVFNIYGNKQQFRVDLEHKQVAICNIFPSQNIDIINFSDILECEIIEDSNTIMKGGVGRAVVGGALAGGVGAIVGANTRASKNVTNSLQVRIITKNINRSLYTINLITTEIKKDSTEYKSAMNFANNVYAMITAIINGNEENSNNLGGTKVMEQNDTDFIEQLERLSKLKNDGMITDKEFEESKQRILESKNQSKVIVEQSSSFEESVDNDIYNIEEKIQRFGENSKIQIIGELRKETGLGLAEAKEIVDDYFNNRQHIMY